ncbi:MAG: hypothetical protein C4332_06840 [Meiothermus sp.]
MTRSLQSVLHYISEHRLRLLVLFIGVLIPLVVFGDLAEDIWKREGFSWDVPLLEGLHAHASAPLDALAVTLAVLGGFWGLVIPTLLLLSWLGRRGQRRDAVFLGLAVAGAALLNLAAKAVFQRTRPDLWPRLVVEDTFSFPSGHAMGSMAFAAALVVLAWPTRWRWPVTVGAGLFTLLVGVSRLYLGVHFPSDVLAGWCAALVWVTGLAVILRIGRVRSKP